MYYAKTLDGVVVKDFETLHDAYVWWDVSPRSPRIEIYNGHGEWVDIAWYEGYDWSSTS